MTREEAINQLQDAKDGYEEYLSSEAISIAIKALEKEPCEDCVSRQTIRLKIADMPRYTYGKRSASIRHLKDFLKKELGDDIIVTEDVCVGFEMCLEYIREFVSSLPSITPQPQSNIKALGEDMRICQKSITDEKVLIGFNMAAALCNKHLAESEG